VPVENTTTAEDIFPQDSWTGIEISIGYHSTIYSSDSEGEEYGYCRFPVWIFIILNALKLTSYSKLWVQ
jgi:hypothetical protein